MEDVDLTEMYKLALGEEEHHLTARMSRVCSPEVCLLSVGVGDFSPGDLVSLHGPVNPKPRNKGRVVLGMVSGIKPGNPK